MRKHLIRIQRVMAASFLFFASKDKMSSSLHILRSQAILCRLMAIPFMLYSVRDIAVTRGDLRFASRQKLKKLNSICHGYLIWPRMHRLLLPNALAHSYRQRLQSMKYSKKLYPMRRRDYNVKRLKKNNQK